MAESNLPKGGSADWLKAADDQLDKIRKFHSARWLGIGPVKSRTSPQHRMQAKAMSDKELMLRSTGMRKQRVERGLTQMRGGKEVKR
jgi:hypothetical protein